MVQSRQKDRWLPFWLIVGAEEERSELRALTMFSFREEAQLHLWLGAPKGHWAIKEATSEELIRMLLGLDPMTEAVDTRLAVTLVSMSRKEFLDLLSSERASLGRPSASVGANAAGGIASEKRR